MVEVFLRSEYSCKWQLELLTNKALADSSHICYEEVSSHSDIKLADIKLDLNQNLVNLSSG